MTIQEGSCSKTTDLSLWLHLAINILSTILLGASNYCMQCLSSPNREEVDRAHSRHIWLDIGVPSVRNLRRVSWSKILLWWLFAFSGIPLHLLYNSAVFSTLAAVDYDAYIISTEFANGGNFNWSTHIPPLYLGDPTLQSVRPNSNSTTLGNKECIQAFGQGFETEYARVYAVSSAWDTSSGGTLNASVPVVQISVDSSLPFYWICSAMTTLGCDTNAVAQHAQSWTLSNAFGTQTGLFKIQHCLVEPVIEACRLQFSLIIMGVVVCCNILKVVGMLLLLRHERSKPLTTLGDAVESFLLKADPTTEHMCLAGKGIISERLRSTPRNWSLRAVSRKWEPKRHRWFKGASLKRWFTCNVL